VDTIAEHAEAAPDRDHFFRLLSPDIAEQVLAERIVFAGGDGDRPPRQTTDSLTALARSGGLILGTLTAYRSRRPGGFSSQDLDRLQWIGVVAALAWQSRQERERSTRMSQSRSRFLNVMSHDLRQPLSICAGYVGMLQDGSLGPLSADAQTVLPTLRRKLAEIDRLIATLLETARLEQGALRLNRRPVDLGTLLERVVDEARQLCPESHRLVLLEPGERVTVRVDPDRVALVFRNLISSAIERAPEGGDIRCMLGRRLDVAVVTVAHPGARGEGMGIQLAHSLAGVHGGELVIESDAYSGTTFRLRLPIDN
jgi:signal transduction histidine kinase